MEKIDNTLFEWIEEEMQAVLAERKGPKPLYDMMRYHLGWLDENLRTIGQYRGKRFRPILCMLAYYSLSGVYDKALPAAAAIELIHNFSLIHDDIEDRDEERRHRQTVWKLWGEAQAINAGDGMHVMANLAALRLKDKNVTDSIIVEVIQILNETVMLLCEGQYLDISFEDRVDVSAKEYLDMIYRKTAALIEASLHVGSLLATMDESVIKRFRKFGRDMGMAFQIRDDIIGTWGDTESTGKPKGSDIFNKKKTLPVVYTFENSSGSEKEALLKIYGKEILSERDVEFIITFMDKKGAYEYAQNTASEFEESAMNELKKLKLNEEAMDLFISLFDFLTRRDH